MFGRMTPTALWSAKRFFDTTLSLVLGECARGGCSGDLTPVPMAVSKSRPA